MHAGADDDDVRRVGHRPLPCPGPCRLVASIGQVRAGAVARQPPDPDASQREAGWIGEVGVHRLERAAPPPATGPTRSTGPSRGSRPRPRRASGAGRARASRPASRRIDDDRHAVTRVQQPERRLRDAHVGLEAGERGRSPAGPPDGLHDLVHGREPEHGLADRRRRARPPRRGGSADRSSPFRSGSSSVITTGTPSDRRDPREPGDPVDDR